MSTTAIYFFGPDELKNKNRCLSNWSKHQLEEDDITFKTAEHYMMYHKAMLMKDRAMAAKILIAPTPKQAKALGRKVLHFDDKKWDEHKEEIMFNGLLLKASQNEEVLDCLLDTGSKQIAEASLWDKIWGIGISIADAKKGKKWNGENLLGEAWMRVRDVIKSKVLPELTIT